MDAETVKNLKEIQNAFKMFLCVAIMDQQTLSQDDIKVLERELEAAETLEEYEYCDHIKRRLDKATGVAITTVKTINSY